MTASGSLPPIEAGPPPPSVPPFIPPIAGTLHTQPARWHRPVFIGLGVAAVAITVAVALVFLRGSGEAPQTTGSAETVAAPAAPLSPVPSPTTPHTPACVELWVRAPARAAPRAQPPFRRTRWSGAPHRYRGEKPAPRPR
jgi:hypothetical protein